MNPGNNQLDASLLPSIAAGLLVALVIIFLFNIIQHPSDRFLGWWTRRRIYKSLKDHEASPIEDVIKSIAYLIGKKRFSEADARYLLKTLGYSGYGAEDAIRSLRSQQVLEFELRYRLIPPHEILYYMPRAARQALEKELKSRGDSLEPERRDVSAELQLLTQKVKDETEATFLDETMKCLQAGANRAAIVMAWNLAFHHIRSWILAKHLPEFNSQLPTCYPKKYAAVSSHGDFPEKESVTLEVCKAAGFLEKSRKGLLDGCLSDRNRYAHPSPANATGPEATGYISKLLKNVILDPFFD